MRNFDPNSLFTNPNANLEMGGFAAKGWSNITDIINKGIIPYVFFIAGFLLLLYLIWGGFGYMTSGGDPKSTEAAKAKITHALTGFIIIFVAYWLVQLLGMIFGIRQFGTIF